MNEQAIDRRMHEACITIKMAYENGTLQELAKGILGQMDIKDELIHQQQIRIMELERRHGIDKKNLEHALMDKKISALERVSNGN